MAVRKIRTTPVLPLDSPLLSAQGSDKDALAASLTDQVVRLERQLEQAKTDLLRAATEAGCLACRKADLGAAGSFSHGSKESPRV